MGEWFPGAPRTDIIAIWPTWGWSNPLPLEGPAAYPILTCPLPHDKYSNHGNMKSGGLLFFGGFCIIQLSQCHFPGGASGEESACQFRRGKRGGFHRSVGKIPWRSAQQPTPVFLCRESHGQRSLVSYGPWGCKELDTTEAT